MTTITLADEKLHTTVSFPYDAEAVALLKDAVPSWDRSFDNATKAWRVGKAWRPKLTEALTKAGHQVRDATDPPPAPPRPKPPAGSTVEFFDDARIAAEATAAALIESIAPDMRGAVFRAMGKALYPDLYPKRRPK